MTVTEPGRTYPGAVRAERLEETRRLSGLLPRVTALRRAGTVAVSKALRRCVLRL